MNRNVCLERRGGAGSGGDVERRKPSWGTASRFLSLSPSRRPPAQDPGLGRRARALWNCTGTRDSRLREKRTRSPALRTIPGTRPAPVLPVSTQRPPRVCEPHSRFCAQLPRPGPLPAGRQIRLLGWTQRVLGGVFKAAVPALPPPRPRGVAAAPTSPRAGQPGARGAEQVRRAPRMPRPGPPLLPAALGSGARGHVVGDGQQRGSRWGWWGRRAGFLPEPPGRRGRQPGLQQRRGLLPGGLGARGPRGRAGSAAAAAAAAPPAGKSDSEIRSQGAPEAAGAGGVDRGAAGTAVRLRGTWTPGLEGGGLPLPMCPPRNSPGPGAHGPGSPRTQRWGGARRVLHPGCPLAPGSREWDASDWVQPLGAPESCSPLLAPDVNCVQDGEQDLKLVTVGDGVGLGLVKHIAFLDLQGLTPAALNPRENRTRSWDPGNPDFCGEGTERRGSGDLRGPLCS